MKETAIEVKDLCIRYRGLKSYSIKKSLLHWKRNPIDEFEAIKHEIGRASCRERV